MFESRLTQAGEELIRAQSRRVLNYATPEPRVPMIKRIERFLAERNVDMAEHPSLAALIVGWVIFLTGCFLDANSHELIGVGLTIVGWLTLTAAMEYRRATWAAWVRGSL